MRNTHCGIVKVHHCMGTANEVEAAAIAPRMTAKRAGISCTKHDDSGRSIIDVRPKTTNWLKVSALHRSHSFRSHNSRNILLHGQAFSKTDTVKRW